MPQPPPAPQVDILSSCKLINYFGKTPVTGPGQGSINIRPVMLQKKNTKVGSSGRLQRPPAAAPPPAAWPLLLHPQLAESGGQSGGQPRGSSPGAMAAPPLLQQQLAAAACTAGPQLRSGSLT
jgi:hypothetical protein